MIASLGWLLVVLTVAPVVALTVWAVADLIRRSDLGISSRAMWMVLVVAIPLAGAMLYLVFRPTRDADIRGFGGPRRLRRFRTGR